MNHICERCGYSFDTYECCGISAKESMETEIGIRKDLAAQRADRDRLRAAALIAQWALREPINEWKGECERKALDAIREALDEVKP